MDLTVFKDNHTHHIAFFYKECGNSMLFITLNFGLISGRCFLHGNGNITINVLKTDFDRLVPLFSYTEKVLSVRGGK